MTRPRLSFEEISGLGCHLVDGFGPSPGVSGEPLLIVLLHGFGAPGGDLVPLAGAVPVPAGSLIACPEAPLELAWGADSRAWWMIDLSRIEAAMVRGRAVELPGQPPREAALAREAVTGLVVTLQERLGVGSDRTILGGFSQGAMLACDVALHADSAPAGLALFSPTILDPREWPQRWPRLASSRVVISHGMQDQLLPFDVSERLRDMALAAGADVRWVAFRGGHEIPGPALTAFARLIADVAAS